MRPIAGPAALLVILSIFLLHRAFGPHAPEPPRSFLNMELALDTDATRGSCYALDTVLVANFALRRDLVRSWSTPADDVWELRAEGIAGPPNAPVHFARTYRFEKRSGRVALADVQSENSGAPKDASDALEDLLRRPRRLHSTPISGCVTGPSLHQRPDQ